MAPRPGAHRKRPKNFCRVTTRRRNLGWIRCLGRRRGARTARALGRGVLGLDGLLLTPLGLPPRRLPAPDLAQAVGVLAVTLVPTPRLVLVPAAFAQAPPRAWPPRSSTARALWFKVVGAHGSAISQGTARGERAIVLLGRLSKPGTRPPLASLPSPEGTRQGRKQFYKALEEGDDEEHDHHLKLALLKRS
jgi:hypothetical protein